jgi:O-antigen ligase
MNRDVLDKWLERGILGLVLAILIFGPLATGAVRTLEFLVVQGLTIAAALLWLVRLWVGTNRKVIWPPVCWAVLAFVGYAVFRYFTADVEYAARVELIRVLVYAFVFIVVLNNVNRSESIQFIGLTLIVVAMAVAAYAIYQFASQSQQVWHFTKPFQYGRRGGGTFINPNHLAGFLELILPVGLAYVLMGRFSHLSKVFLGYACLVILAGIGVSVSRGGWLATAVMLLIFFGFLLRSREHRLPAAILLFAVVIGGAVFVMNSGVFQQRVERTFREGEVVDLRKYSWDFATRMWKDNPWFGVGPGHFDLRIGSYRVPEIDSQVRPVYAHSDYLNTLADWGTVGALLVVAVIVLLAIGIFKSWPHVSPGRNELRRKRSTRAAFLFGASMGWLALGLHCVVEFNMQIPGIATLAVTWVALIAGYRRYENEEFGVYREWAPKLLVTALICAGAGYLSAQEIRRANEYVWIKRAESAQNSKEKLEALKRAATIDPKNFHIIHRVGESIRELSWQGNDDYEALAKEAIEWFDRGIQLNPFDPNNYIRRGMCFDWIGRRDEAFKSFEEALKRDPNSYYTTAFMGWHYFQVEDYDKAKQWFRRSLEIYNNYMNRNRMPVTYLEIIAQREAERQAEPDLLQLPEDLEKVF